MPNFNQSYKKVMASEGGYVHDPDDPGGETYKGVARKMNPSWSGWTIVDRLKREKGFPKNLDRDADLQGKIEAFYRAGYWAPVRGDEIADPDVAHAIFDFAVNAGVKTSVAIAQTAGRVTADGVMGPVTVAAVNRMDPRVFMALFTLGRIARYMSICEKRPTSRKYLYGWIRRSMEV